MPSLQPFVIGFARTLGPPAVTTSISPRQTAMPQTGPAYPVGYLNLGSTITYNHMQSCCGRILVLRSSTCFINSYLTSRASGGVVEGTAALHTSWNFEPTREVRLLSGRPASTVLIQVAPNFSRREVCARGLLPEHLALTAFMTARPFYQLCYRPCLGKKALSTPGIWMGWLRIIDGFA